MNDRRTGLLATGAIFAASLVSCGETSGQDPLRDQILPKPTSTLVTRTIIVVPQPTENPTQAPVPPPMTSPNPEKAIIENRLLREELKPTYRSVRWDTLNLIDPINVQTHQALILKWANERDIPSEIIAVTIDTESHGRKDPPWDKHVNQETGEVTGAGLMGIRPYDEEYFPNRPTAEELISDNDLNIAIGTSILKTVFDDVNQGNGNWFLTFAHYNAGNEAYNGLSYAIAIYNKLGWLKDPDHQKEISAVLTMYEEEFAWAVDRAIALQKDLIN